jgi:hypothetical protein
MEITFNPLGKVMEIASHTGFEITYAFEDLVFSEHSIFIIQFDKENDTLLHLFFNIDCEISTAENIKQSLFKAAEQHEIKIEDSGKFRINAKTNSEEIDIEFINCKN